MSFLTIDKIFNKAILNSGVTVDIVLENTSFDSVEGLPYLSCVQIPQPVTQSSLGVDGCDLHYGIYQININYPQGKGTTALKTMADTLNAVFYNGAIFTEGAVKLRIYNVSIERINVAGGYAIMPLTIEYNTHIERS